MLDIRRAFFMPVIDSHLGCRSVNFCARERLHHWDKQRNDSRFFVCLAYPNDAL